MVNGKTTTGFSWADEVEKEQEEAQAQLLHQQKPNPFGSARPREIILEERGINWRSLDYQLQSSKIREEKDQSKPIPLAAASVNRNDQFSVINGGFEQNNRQIQNLRNVHDDITPSSAVSFQQKQTTVPLVPKLRYPPKNVLHVMEKEMQRSHTTKSVGQSKQQYERDLHEFGMHMRRNFNAEEQMWNINYINISNHGGEKENMEFRYGRNHIEKRLIGPLVEQLPNGGRWVDLNGKLERVYIQGDTQDRHLQSANNGEEVNHVEKRLIGPLVEQLPNGGRWVDLNGKLEKVYIQGDTQDRHLQSANNGGDQRYVKGEVLRRNVSPHGEMEEEYFQRDIQDRRELQSARKGGSQKKTEWKLGRRGHFYSNTEGADFGGNYERGGRSITEEGYWDMGCKLLNIGQMQERVPYNSNLCRGFKENFGRKVHLDSNMEGANIGRNYERRRRSIIEEGYWDMECELMNSPMQERIPYNLNLEKRGFGDNSRKRAMASTSDIIKYNQRRRRR
ncbi:hypothetical protein AAC387_Pa03g1991 [Persea americana]